MRVYALSKGEGRVLLEDIPDNCRDIPRARPSLTMQSLIYEGVHHLPNSTQGLTQLVWCCAICCSCQNDSCISAFKHAYSLQQTGHLRDLNLPSSSRERKVAHASASANPAVQAALTCWCRLMPSNKVCDLCSSATMAEPMGRPLIWWRMMLRSTAGLLAKRSTTCDGTSIKSMGPRVPTAGPNVNSSMPPTWETPSRHCRM